MHNVTTSRHIRSATELFLMVPIKQEFVPITDRVMTYSSRVSTVLSALFDLRQQKVERGFGDPTGPIELLATIYRVQWTVLEPFDEQVRIEQGSKAPRQITRPQLVLTSHFDSSWEDYFYHLVSTGAGLLDLIFSHCEGYEGQSCGDGYEAFSSFIRRHQRPCDFMFAASPEVTVGDIRFLKTFATQQFQAPPPILLSVADEAKREAALASAGRAPDERARNAYHAIIGLHEIRQRLFSDVAELGERTGRELFDEAVGSVLEQEPDFARLRAALQQLTPAPLPSPQTPSPVHDPKYPENPAAWAERVVEEARARADSSQPLASASLAAIGGELASEEAAAQASPVPLKEVQGNVLSGYVFDDAAKACMAILVRCEGHGGFKSLLCGLTYTSEAESQSVKKSKSGDVPPAYLNLALTYRGLERMDLGGDVLERFPREFREGMEERAGILGDVSENHPHFWLRPQAPQPYRAGAKERIALSIVDAVVLIHASTAEQLSAWVARVDALAGVEVLSKLALFRAAGGELSQPIPKQLALLQRTSSSGAEPRRAQRDERALGEFLLGYPDAHGRVAASADKARNRSSRELFVNGTFLAMRKMQYDPDVAKKKYVRAVARAIEKRPTHDHAAKVQEQDVAALFVGRRDDDHAFLRPLPGTDANPPTSNDFDFSGDPAGEACPLHSHVRRANPRSPDAARIVRRGLSYEDDPDGAAGTKERGLLFMAYNASLSQQYEIVQRYVNGANSTGLTSYQNDLLCAAPDWGHVRRVVSLPAAWSTSGLPEPFELPPRTEPLVTLRWGLYFFVPARAAREWLKGRLESATKAAGTPSSEDTTPEDTTQKIMTTEDTTLEDTTQSSQRGSLRLTAAACPADARPGFAWKRLLEEVPEAGSAQAREALDIWAAIRAPEHAGVLQALSAGDPDFPGGLIVVGSEELAREVLNDDGSRFSVQEYAQRIRRCSGDHYLAHDPAHTEPGELSYEQQSALPNALLESFHPRALAEALTVARTFLRDPANYRLNFPGELAEGRPRDAISVYDLARAVVAQLCASWFGMPEARDSTGLPALIASLERFLLCSRYTFQASPGRHLAEKAQAEHDAMEAAYTSAARGVLFDRLKSEHYSGDQTRVSIGSVVGFAPPTVGAITRILDQWIESDELWTIRAQALNEAQLRSKIYEALGRTPSPPLLYRTALQETVLGDVKVPRGAQIVIGLQSVYLDAKRKRCPEQPEAWLFGGARAGEARTVHGCPAREAGTDVILGTIQALFELGNIKRERRLVLSYDRPEAADGG